MESHGGRSLETPPRGVASEQRTVTPLLPLDVRESLPSSSSSSPSSSSSSGGDGMFRRVSGSDVPPAASRRSNCPVRVHSRPQMAIVTAPPPQTCVLQPITSSGPIRTSNNLARSGSRTGHRTRNASPASGSGSDMAGRSHFSTVSSSSGRLENSMSPSTPVLSGRTHSLSTSRLQNANQFSNSLTNSATRSRTGAGSAGGGGGVGGVGIAAGGSSVEVVSLTLPRPETERTANEYVETPLRSGLSLIEPKLEASSHRIFRTTASNASGGAVGVSGGDGIGQRDSNFAMVTLPVTGLERNAKHGERSSQYRHGDKKVVTSQPSATFKKDRYHSESQCSRQSDDIICSECKRCRCESCRTPRPLPSKWLCGTCHCSAESVVDYATCLCCAKAFFYHCSNDEAVSENDPCSCSPDMFYARWGCLGIMSCFLPCLLCYWPFRGLVQICESCHQYYSSQGCRCQKLYQQPAPLTFEKRLLDSPE